MKRNNLKKTLIAILTGAMLIGALPLQSFADDTPATMTDVEVAKQIAIEQAYNDLQEARAELLMLIDTKASTDALNQAFDELDDRIAAAEELIEDLQATDNGHDARLTALESNLESARIDLQVQIDVVRYALEDEIKALQDTLEGKASTDALNSATAAIYSELETLEDQLASARMDFNAQLTVSSENAQAQLDAARYALETEIKALQDTLEGKASTDALNSATAAIRTDLDELEQEITKVYEDAIMHTNVYFTALESEIYNITKILEDKADQAALDSAVDGLQDRLSALESALTLAQTELEKEITKAYENAVAHTNVYVTVLQSNIDAVAKDLEGKADQAALDALEAVVDTVSQSTTSLEAELTATKKTIKANYDSNRASIDALESNVYSLREELDAKADVSALNNAINTLNASIEAAKKAATDADTALEEELNTILSDHYAAVSARIDAAESAISALRNTMDTKADQAELDSTVDALEVELSALESTLMLAQTELEKKITKAYTDAVTHTNGCVTDLQSNIDTVAKKLDGKADKTALDALKSVTATLSQKATLLEADLTAAKKTLDANYNSNRASINALESNVSSLREELDAKADVSALNNAINTLNASIEAAKKAATDADTALEEELNTILTDHYAAASARIDAAETAISVLRNTMDTKAGKAELDGAVDTLEAELSALESALTLAQTELEKKITKAYTDAVTHTNGCVTVLQGNIDAVAKKLDGRADKTALDALKSVTATLSQKATLLEAELTATKKTIKENYDSNRASISALESNFSNIRERLDTALATKADTSALNNAINTLNASIEAAKKAATDADKAMEEKLTKAIATAKSEAVSAADTALTKAKNELQTAIKAKADASALTSAVSTLNASIDVAKKASTDADTALKTDLLASLSDVNDALLTALEEKVDTTALQATITELRAKLADGERDLKTVQGQHEQAMEQLEFDLNRQLEQSAETYSAELARLSAIIEENAREEEERNTALLISFLSLLTLASASVLLLILYKKGKLTKLFKKH